MTILPYLTRPDDELALIFQNLKSRRDVADLLEIPNRYLIRILYKRRDRNAYRRFTIPKRGGGTRNIEAPPPTLSILQSKLNRVFQIVYWRRRVVHGYLTRRSVLTNANAHIGMRWILNVDLKDFFPSINFGRIRGMLMAPPYEIGDEAATVIAQICSYEDRLPQGSPSSPMISNMVCARLDGELLALAQRHRLRYSRFCDDLTFSTRQSHFPTEIAAIGSSAVGAGAVIGAGLQGVIESNGFEVNESKTRLLLRDCHQDVTGITVNEFANVRQSLIREVRAMIHAWNEFGLGPAARRFVENYSSRSYSGSAEEAFVSVLRGKLQFIGLVRGKTDFLYMKYRAQLHRLDPTAIAAPLSSTTRPVSRRSYRGPTLQWARRKSLVERGVAHVTAEDEKGVHSGTAFAIANGGLVTALHNVRGRVTVIMEGRAISIAEVQLHPTLGRSLDCAVLVCDHGLQLLQAEPHLPRPGDECGVVGYATIPQRQATIGIYTGRVEAHAENYERTISYIQTNIQSAGGLSGGPAIDASGNVVGLVSQSSYEDTGEGVPGREFMALLPLAYALEVQQSGVRLSLPLEASS